MADTTQNTWLHAWIVGIGECGFWADQAEVETAWSGSSPVAVTHLTQIIAVQKATMLRPLAKEVTINTAHIAALHVMDAALAKAVFAGWDRSHGNGLAFPSFEERKRLNL